MIKSWQQIDQLVSEQKFEEALAATEDRLERAKELRDEDEWTRALIKATQLRIGLHGYETQVRWLKEEPWPRAPVYRSVVNLFYARTVATYAQAYQWEIRQREKVEATGPVDLKAWTMDQLAEEIQRAYQEVWDLREALGEEPVSALSEYVRPNNYPAGIRDTLRDAVTYLRVEHLADTTGWRPEHHQDLYRLDWAALLRAEPAWAEEVDFTSPEVHPLVKIAAALGDLEAWHRARGEKEAALEAHLERLRRLFSADSDPDRHRAIREDAQAAVDNVADRPWWSMGMATLANFQQADGMLVRAHQTASRGAAKFAGSVGAQVCLSIQKSIEAPDYHLESMLQDGPGQRSIRITHKNLGALSFRAYPVDLLQRIASAKDYNLLPGYREFETFLGKRPVAEWTVPLPATPDFQMHQTYSTPPLSRPGLYVILASARQDFQPDANRISGLNVIVTDLAAISRSNDADGSVEVTVARAGSGELVSGAEVSLYQYDYQRGHHVVDRERTGRDGTVTFRRSGGRRFESYFVLVRQGDQIAVDPHGLYFGDVEQEPIHASALIYTDRSIYRPNQKLLFKVIAFEGSGEQARYHVLRRSKVSVRLVDANGETIETKELTTNEFGSASGEFTLPAGRLLGQWSLQSTPDGWATVRVEEYKRPTFNAELGEAEGALRLNKPATFTGTATYYFGLPVVNGTVRWRVTRAPVFPWWWGAWWLPPPEAPRILATGTAPLDEQGQFRIVFTPEAEEPKTDADRAVSYLYEVTADVTDEGGETRSASRTFRLGWVSVEGEIRQEPAFFTAGRPEAFELFRSDLNGTPRAGKGSWEVFALEAPPRPLMPSEQPVPGPESGTSRPEGQPEVRTPGDRLQPRWASKVPIDRILASWKDGAKKAGGVVVHDDKGLAAIEVPALAPGAYRIRYRTQDDFGATAETFRTFVVANAQTRIAVPQLLLAQRSSAKVGEQVQVFAGTGFEGQRMVVEVYRAGRRVSRREVRGGKDPAIVTVPITEADRGGFTVTATLVRDHQLLHDAVNVFVPWDDRELKVEFATFRDKIRPGAKETWRVTVRGPDGANPGAGAAELLAYMYDEALDAFAPHTPPSTSGLWPSRVGEPPLRTSFGESYGQWISRRAWPEIPGAPSLDGDVLRFYEDYGVGGPGIRSRRMRAFGAPGAAPDLEKKAMRVDREEQAAGSVTAAGNTGVGKGALLMAQTPAAAVDKDLGGRAGGGAQPGPVRTQFAETAFWAPHLLLQPDGSATIEFTVPDSVTGWDVWVHAVTKDLRGGSVQRKTRSVKDLMVRPYVPRFLREGDQAELAVVVNNASDAALEGTVHFDIVDTETQQSVLSEFGFDAKKATVPFRAEAAKGARLTFPIVAPRRTGSVAFRVTATSGDLSDGELRPLPVLPSRMHLVQSRFVTLKNADRRVLSFPDMAKDDDPTRINEQLVVSLDGQLFYQVLNALPYLVNYPYECTEQTLNRFVSTGILSSLYDQYPAVAAMSKKLSARKTQLETWDAADPNRKMALEETPWLALSRGGIVDGAPSDLVNVLDPKIARAEREASLAKLRKAQTQSGGFPWWPGGPPSPYMTLYILHGLARAADYGVEVPKDVTVRAFAYVAQHFREEYAARMLKEDCCWEFLTFLNYVASSFPDASYTGDALTHVERETILTHSFQHWKSHSPYLKGYLALTLKRMGRPEDAKLVWDSVMDSAKTTDDQGTFWAPEDRAWLWYNDTIETHAFALTTLMELQPQDARRHGLVQWLLINKKLSHWKSTRATAEAIFALTKYLEREGALGVKEEAHVTVGSKTFDFTFQPDEFTGKNNRVVIPGPKFDPKTMSTIVVEKPSKGLMFASAAWHFSTDRLPEEEQGDFFSVSRTYYLREKNGREAVLKPLAEGTELHVGDEVEVHLSLRTKHAAEYVHLRDPRAAGLEPENAVSRYKWQTGLGYYEETRDSGTNFFFDWLPVGEYTFRYRLRANMAGQFRVGPATVQSMYAPEFNAYSVGAMLRIVP
ncbi:MAG: hypothetical protein IRZ16_18600 [Myxococcaceae bacterium]|nr:hypothetical protein [Myxococcaceae bacterium]